MIEASKDVRLWWDWILFKDVLFLVCKEVSGLFLNQHGISLATTAFGSSVGVYRRYKRPTLELY